MILITICVICKFFGFINFSVLEIDCLSETILRQVVVVLFDESFFVDCASSTIIRTQGYVGRLRTSRSRYWYETSYSEWQFCWSSMSWISLYSLLDPQNSQIIPFRSKNSAPKKSIQSFEEDQRIRAIDSSCMSQNKFFSTLHPDTHHWLMISIHIRRPDVSQIQDFYKSFQNKNDDFPKKNF